MDSRLRINEHGWSNHDYIALKLATEQYKKNGIIDHKLIYEQTGVVTNEDTVSLVKNYQNSKRTI